MFVRKKFDKTTGVYTSPDSVENFEIRYLKKNELINLKII